MSETIHAIYGHEPPREGEIPFGYVVGETLSDGDEVTKIERWTENFGDHGLLWFKVYCGDRLAREVAGRAIAEVHYRAAASRTGG